MRRPRHSYPGGRNDPGHPLTAGRARPAGHGRAPLAAVVAATALLVSGVPAVSGEPALPPVPPEADAAVSSGDRPPAASLRSLPTRGALADGARDEAATADTLPQFVGTVLSRQTGEPVGGAQVMIPSQDRRTLTDENGRFRLDSLSPGRHEVKVRYLGYTTNPRSVELRLRHATRAELWLERTVLAVEDLEVEVDRPRVDPMAGFKRRREDGLGLFLDRGDIEERNPATTSDLFRSLAGVSVEPNRLGVAEVTVRRFGGRCRPTVYVDGVLTSGMMRVDYVVPEAIIGIEVYRGPAEVPPQFNKPTRQGCGTILIWTRIPGYTPPGVEPDTSSSPPRPAAG